MNNIEAFIHKKVAFKYKGKDLCFYLSHALFSSFDIDQGSKLLLKSIANLTAENSIKTVLDIGCGVGVLGIAFAKSCPGVQLTMRDRDALACKISKKNAVLNDLPASKIETALFLEGLEEERFDLVLCNVPAKAGPPVLNAFLKDMPRIVSDTGYAAIVIVNTIAEKAKASLLQAGAELIKEERSSNHSVYVFRRGQTEGSGNFAEAFWTAAKRSTEECGGQTSPYSIDGYWGLAEFDTASFDTGLLMELADKACTGLLLRKVALINPGLGRFAAFLKNRQPMAGFDLVGRDLMALMASSRNIQKQDAEARNRLFFFPSELASATIDLLVERPDIIPRTDFVQPAWAGAMNCLKIGGSYMVAMPTAYMGRFQKQRPKGFVKLAEKKKKGFSCAVYRLEAKNSTGL